MKSKNDNSTTPEVPTPRKDYDPKSFPNPDMVHVLKTNKVDVRFKKDGQDLLLWCNYSKLNKDKPGQGLEVWGRSQNIIEHITRTVLSFYPRAEVTSQNMNANIVFRLNS